MEFWDNDFRPLHLYDLLAALAKREKPESYLGIGVWKGDCLANMLRGGAPSVRKIVVCDPFFGHCGGPTDPGFLEPKLRDHGFTGELEVIHANSDPNLGNWWQPGVKFDMALIDGDHNFGPAWYDLCTVVPRTRITLVHDLNHSTVWNAFRKFVQMDRYPFWCTAEIQGTGVILNARY